MDAALSFRSPAAGVPGQTRAEAAPVRDSVRTDLPQLDQSVAAMQEQSAQDASYARPKRREAGGPLLTDETGRELDRELEYNKETKDVVLRRLDPRTGRVVDQFPTESQLKLRAYVRAELAEKADAAEAVSREA